MTRTLPAAIARIAYCRDSIARRVSSDPVVEALHDALVEQYNDTLTLLAGVDDLGDLDSFQKAVEAALGEYGRKK